MKIVNSIRKFVLCTTINHFLFWSLFGTIFLFAETSTVWGSEQVTSTKKILAYTQYADTSREYPNTLTAIGSVSTNYTVTQLTNYSNLATVLPGYDILLIPELEKTSASTLISIGTSWATTLADFVNNGGVVIVCDFVNSYHVLTSASLMSISSATSITNTTVSVSLPGDPVTQGVSPTYTALSGSATYTTTEQNVVVERYGSSTGPVVINKQMGLGHVVLIGHDYFSSNPDQDRIVGNAVFNLPTIRDNLQVYPGSNFSASGIVGGPFDPLCMTYTLTNTDAGTINWSALSTQPWINVSPSSGTLASGASVTVDVCFNSAANALSVGNYDDTITFTNDTSGINQVRTVALDVVLEQAKLIASDGANSDYFGYAVAIDEGYAIVGAYGDDDGGSSSGAAYMFKRDGNSWIEQIKLRAWDAASGDIFGFSVAISGDYAIIGARDNDDNGGNSGSAYIFHRSGDTWVAQIKLLPSDGYSSDYFGNSVAIDGDYAIVGAYGDDDNGGNSGSAYIFQRSGSTWLQQDKLTASDGYNSDSFGFAVSISGDYALVGANGDDDNGGNSGSAYIFQRSGSTWLQQDKLIASDGYNSDNFGYAVSINGDYALVGAYGDDDLGSSSGSAYIFQRSGSSWLQQDKLIASDGYNGDNFGYAVSISGDYALVGAYGDDDLGSSSGSSYVFEQSGGTWIEQLKQTPSDGQAGDLFGGSVAIDGTVTIVGAYQDDDKGTSSGSAYIFGKGDSLAVTAEISPESFNILGYQYGPFVPDVKTYFLTNIGADTLDWVASTTYDWVDIDIDYGALSPGATTTVIVSINSLTDLLTPGIYEDKIVFTNTTSGTAVTRYISLEVLYIPGEIHLDPNNVVFGDTVVGVSSRQVVTIENQSALHDLYVNDVSLLFSFDTFFDEFPETTFNPDNWTITSGTPTIDSVGISEPSEPYSLRLNGNSGVDETVESSVMDLSGTSGLTLSYWYEQTGGGESPDSGEDLVISYWNGGVWVELDRQMGSGGDMSSFQQRVITLPAAAYHSDFQLQIKKAAGSNCACDDWFVDDVYIGFSEEGSADYELNVPSFTRIDSLSWIRLENKPSLPILIPPLGSTSFDVVFEPSDYKAYDATIIIASDDLDEVELELPVSGIGIVDYLTILPEEDFMFYGHLGGPFVPSNQTYYLINNAPFTVDWSVSDPNWLDTSPTSGTINAGETIALVISPNSTATKKGKGIYNDEIIFVNETTTFEHVHNVSLDVYAKPKIWVNPQSIDITVEQESSGVETLTIGNTGGDSSLIYTLLSQENGSVSTGITTTATVSGLAKPVKTDFKNTNFTSLSSGVVHEPDQLLVRYRPEVISGQLKGVNPLSVLSRLGGGTIITAYDLIPGLNLIQLPAGTSVEDALVTFNADADILYAQPNYLYHTESVPNDIENILTALPNNEYGPDSNPNDTYYPNLWGMHNSGQSGGTIDADIDAPEAWDITKGDNNIVVAVIDTGVDYNHVDLSANMWKNALELNGLPGVDDDGNGYIDDIYGYDFYNNDNNPIDDNGHGTHCAGTIGATGDNGTGVVGVCWNTQIMAVKFLNASGGGNSADAISSIQYAVMMGADVLSNSWGGTTYDQGLKDAIDAAGSSGVVFVAAAGNDNGSNNDVSPHYPSNYDSPNILSVMASDRNDNRSSFSNYGPTSVDLAAPGSSIYSCRPSNQYQYLNGTSMATPHVAGACALLLSLNHAMTTQQIVDNLIDTVDLIFPGQSVSQGRLNLFNAVSAVPQSSGWLQMLPDNGSVPAGETMDIELIFDGNRPTGIYHGEITVISNDPQFPELTIPVTFEVIAAESNTELFASNDNDLSGKSLVFKPDDAGDYTACNYAASTFPVDPVGGNILTLNDDDYLEINIGDDLVWFYGIAYESFYIASNGYITFQSGDIQHIESLVDHYRFPRISALFDDLDPTAGGTISWKKLSDRIVVTYEDIPEYGTANLNSFQIELISNKKIRITYLDITATDGLAGLSDGEGVSPYFVETDLSGYMPCNYPDFNGDASVNLSDFGLFAGKWLDQHDLSVTAKDEFNTVAYNGSNGDYPWGSDWIEQGENNGPAVGLLQVLPEGLLSLGHEKIIDPGVQYLSRAVNLLGATRAMLSFEYEMNEISLDTQHTLYLVGDDVPTGSMSTDMPTDTSLDNFDPHRDSYAGLLIKKGGSGVNEGNNDEYQTWLISSGAVDIDGPARFTIWTAMKDFTSDKSGNVMVYLVDCNGSGGDCFVIAQGQINRNRGGGWHDETVNFGDVTYSIADGRSLGIKIIVKGNSDDDMWFAYDTTSYMSGLTYTHASGGTSASVTTLEISDDGGALWTTLATYGLGAGSDSVDLDISDYISTNTQIRFGISAGGDEWLSMVMQIDNVQVAFDNASTPWSPWAGGLDLNQDYVIDISDLSILVGYWLE